MASSDTWFERMAANANNNMDVSVKRCPCFLRGSFTCANALCQSRSRGSSCSIPLSLRHFWIASVYFICLFFLDGSMFLFHLILSKKRLFVTLPLPFLERISPVHTCPCFHQLVKSNRPRPRVSPWRRWIPYTDALQRFRQT